VLEHDPEPRATLAAARRLLAPGGTLVIEVPDAGSPMARRLGRSWPALEAPEHVCHYTERSLRRAVELADLDLMALERGGTAGWQALNGEHLLAWLASGRAEWLLRIEARSVLVRSALIGVSAASRSVERALFGPSRLLAWARR
jgi:SAM-dependent methyltransferase